MVEQLSIQYPRRIRTFVRRQSRMTKTQSQALQDLWSRYGLAFEKPFPSFTAIFERSAPLVVEIGFGDGHALLDMARQQTENNFIGIEVYRPGIGNLLMALANDDVNNVRVYGEDAIDVIQTQIADDSVARFQIFFPDPWPKRRHHKRRLIQPEFLALIVPKLQKNGFIHLATDWQPYAKQMLSVLSAHPGLKNCAVDGDYAKNENLRSITKFERRGKRLGHGVWDIIFRKP